MGRDLYGDKGTLKANVFDGVTIPAGQAARIHRDVKYEYEQYPRTGPRRTWSGSGAGHPLPHAELPARALTRGSAGRRYRGGIHLDGPSCILANNAQALGRTLNGMRNGRWVVGDDEANACCWRANIAAPWVHPELDNI